MSIKDRLKAKHNISLPVKPMSPPPVPKFKPAAKYERQEIEEVIDFIKDNFAEEFNSWKIYKKMSENI